MSWALHASFALYEQGKASVGLASGEPTLRQAEPATIQLSANDSARKLWISGAACASFSLENNCSSPSEWLLTWMLAASHRTCNCAAAQSCTVLCSCNVAGLLPRNNDQIGKPTCMRSRLVFVAFGLNEKIQVAIGFLEPSSCYS